MSFLQNLLRPERREVKEYLDEPFNRVRDISIEELAGNLAQMRWLDEVSGGVNLALQGIERVWRPKDKITALDVGAGSAALLIALAKWADKRELKAELVGIDLNPKVLDVAARAIDGYPIRLAIGDALALPFADDSFDVSLATLMMHHFAPEAAVRLLQEMYRVSRNGIIIVDLTRSRLLQVILWVLTRVGSRNRITRHDGPVSALRAYTIKEAQDLAWAAGLEAEIRHRLFRMVITCRKR
ncbi:MAG: methyltransferase domain-containing protein [Armatimonadota bacterium]|nr:methyltransferase domain-containing protein [Armatimonadota bacterium]